jgi:hypothetical protein
MAAVSSVLPSALALKDTTSNDPIGGVGACLDVAETSPSSHMAIIINDDSVLRGRMVERPFFRIFG